MKRRIVVAIVIVAALAVVAFGVPLAVVIDQEYEGQALLRLERGAIVAVRDVPAGWQPGDPLVLGPPDGDTVFGVYDATGTRVFGQGPQAGDNPVRVALAARIGEAEQHHSYVITVPITDGGRVVGALRAEQRIAVTDRRIRAAWASMGLLAFAVIGASILLARRLARRISVPVEALQASAARLGVEGDPVALSPSGMVEIDDVAAALETAATRIGESVEQERAFSAEVSHQLRTPITGLRLLIETELLAPRPDPTLALRDAAVVVGRLEATVDDLLSLARNRPTDRDVVDLEALLRDLDDRWRPAYSNAGRSLSVNRTQSNDQCDVTVVASKSALGHIMDVLVDNALRHGIGEVVVSRERIDGGVALRVADHGALPEKDPEAVFSRPRSHAHGGRSDSLRRGIGLTMARRLAHAEGGELVCSSPAPTTFSVLLLEREQV